MDAEREPPVRLWRDGGGFPTPGEVRRQAAAGTRGIVRDRATPPRIRAPRPRARLGARMLAILGIALLLAACTRVGAESVEVLGPGGAALGANSREANSREANSREGGARAGAPASAAAPLVLPVASGLPPKQINPTPAPRTGAAGAVVVVDDASGAVLYERNARKPLPPASLTKIATAALVIDRGRLDETVTVDIDFDDPALDDATVMGLRRGDRFRIRDLLYGTLLSSGADASLALGRAVSGSDQAFVRELNAFMVSIGLRDSHFTDSHGLGGPTHLSTAYDIAMLSRYSMRQTLFAQISRTRVWKAVGSRTLEVYNTWQFDYRGGDGVKTGYTEEAGPTVSASATRAGHRVFVVILDSNSRDRDLAALMDWVFSTYCWGDGQLGCVAR